MSHIFRGRLCGYLCPHCPEPLSNVTIRFYGLAKDANRDELVAANAKDTLRVLTTDEVDAKSDRLAAEVQTDADGNFELELPDALYESNAVEIDVLCRTVPHLKTDDADHEPVQFTVTTLEPEWTDQQQDRIWAWDYCIPARFWCGVRTLFGAWTICGRVVDCETKVAVSGVTVSAFDTDWFQHDALGSGISDANGQFRIDYLASDFKKTPFSPFINVEWVGGPDLFFKAEAGGSVVLDEDPSRGRDPDRENSGPCACVELCVEGQAPPVNNPWFTHIGDFHIIGDIDPVSGLTNKSFSSHGGPDYGFFGSMKLKGFCPKLSPVGTPDPMRYRFLYEHSDNPGVQVPLTGAGLLADVVVGSRLIQWKVTSNSFEWTFQSIVVAGSGATPDPTPQPAGPGPWGAPPAHVIEPDTDGWIAVDANALDGGFYGPLIRFRSTSAVPGGGAPGTGAGNAVSDPKNGSSIKLIYEAGPVGSTATFTNQVDNILVNNWAEVRQLDLVQFGGPGGACQPLTSDLDVLYTVDHQLLKSWSLSITSASPSDPGTVIPPMPAGATPRGAAGTHHENISTWDPCSYRVNLSSARALTNGEQDDDGDTTLVTFCA